MHKYQREEKRPSSPERSQGTYATSMSSSIREMISPCSATMVAMRVYIPVIYVIR
jgi:hypothetical protein